MLTADGAVRLVSALAALSTAPWGVTDQDWFVNACIAVRTKLSPRELLRRCQAVENDMGRVRTLHWGPRIIDVDILTYRDLKIDEPDLVVPHPLIAERAFVLVPLKDVAPDLRIDGASLDAMLAKLDASDVVPHRGLSISTQRKSAAKKPLSRRFAVLNRNDPTLRVPPSAS